MKRAIAISLALLVTATASAPAAAARRRPTAPPEREALSIAFVPLEESTTIGAVVNHAGVDVGTVSHFETGREPANLTRVVRRVGVRIDGASASGTATLTAHLTDSEAGCSVRVGGRTLYGSPVVISARQRTGRTEVYTIELEVPTARAEGSLLTNIHFEATTND